MGKRFEIEDLKPIHDVAIMVGIFGAIFGAGINNIKGRK